MAEGEDRGGSAVRLGLAILLLWLAGLAFFIALEGQQFLPEQQTSNNYMTTILQEIARRAQTKEKP